MLREQLSKRSGQYVFNVVAIDVMTKGSDIPLLSASTINSIRRLLASDLDDYPCGKIPLARGTRQEGVIASKEDSSKAEEEPLMLSKYCIRYELGLCPRSKIHGSALSAKNIQTSDAKSGDRLFLRNNNRRLTLRFDCSRCEMRVEK